MLILIVAIAPAVALLIYFYHKDKYEKEPLNLLVKAFFGGFFITFLVLAIKAMLVIFIKPARLFYANIFFRAFVLAGLIEEWCKFYVFRSIIYENKEFDEPYDGIMYGVMISLGFATLENISYVLSSFLKIGYIGVFNTGISRAIFSVPGHAYLGVIMGYYLSLAKFTRKRRLKEKYIYTGLGLAVLAHGLYDFFVLTNTVSGILCMILFSICLLRFSLQTADIQAEKSPFKIKRHKQRKVFSVGSKR